MNARSAAARALPLTFTIYLLESGIALLISLPLGVELAQRSHPALPAALSAARWLDRFYELLPALRVAGGSLLLHGALLTLLAPWLHMAWLNALSAPHSVGSALRRGAAHYLRACAVSAGVLAVGLVLATPFSLLWLLADHELGHLRDAQLHDILLIAAALPLGAVLYYCSVLHDLTRVHALESPAWPAMRLGLQSSLRMRIHRGALLWSSAALLLYALPWLFVAGSAQGTIVTNVVLQTTTLSGLYVRSCWLAFLLACTGQLSTSRTTHD